MLGNGSTTSDRALGRLEGKIDGMMLLVGEVKSDVNQLRTDFSEMEKGRLSRLELSFNTLKTETEYKAKQHAMIVASIASVAGSVISGVILYALIS